MIFQNENKYTYLKKVFDSKDFELTYKVKIFEIDHEEFDSHDHHGAGENRALALRSGLRFGGSKGNFS